MKRSAKLKMTNPWSQCVKNITKPFRFISWADGHDMLLSKKGCVWYITHDKRWISPNDNVKISDLTTPQTSFMMMPARKSENLVCMLASLNAKDFANPEIFAGCPAGVPANLKLFEWSLIEYIFISFLLTSSSPPPRIFSSKFYPSFLLRFFISSKRCLLIIVLLFFSSTFAHKRYFSPPTT